MTTKISGNNLQADISIDTTGNQIFNGTLKLDANFPTGTDNVALGNTALDNGSLTGSQNVAIGAGTLTDTDSGADNTAVGFEALKVVTTGTNNTAIGSGAGSTITSGSNLTLVGYNATPSAVDATNEITLGDANVTDVRIPGAGVYIDSTGLGIGTATPAVALDVVGAISATGNLTSLGIDDNATSTAITIDSSENVGIGTASPEGKLHIQGDNVGTPSTNADDLIIEKTVDTGLSILSTTTGRIFFGDASDNDVGGIVYAHTDNSMRFSNNASESMRIDSSGNVGIGTTSPGAELDVLGAILSPGEIRITNTGGNPVDEDPIGRYSFYTTDGSGIGAREIASIRGINGSGGTTFAGELGFYTSPFNSNVVEAMRIDLNGFVGIGTNSPIRKFNVYDSANPIVGRIQSGQSSSWLQFASSGTGTASRIGSPDGSGQASIALMTADQERMRVDDDGRVLIGTTGTLITSNEDFSVFGLTTFERAGTVSNFNRLSTDGTIIGLYQSTALEGTISVSGSTVSYNGFTGTHWSRFTDNSTPTILKGTVLESLDEMCDWYNLEFNDNDGNPQKIPYVLQDGQSNGDVITYDWNTEKKDEDDNDIIEQVQATIVKEADIKHVKSKVSNTVDAKNVYGVFIAYDEDGEGYNDFYVASVGSFVVRIKANETIAKGDLLQSNGDGTAKVQTDDAIRSSSFAKVLSTTVIETYEDGSYLVPCSLMC